MKSKKDAISDVRTKRAKLEETVEVARARFSIPQLAEDAINFFDPDLTLLGRIKTGVKQNRLLSLAVLAGAGWLVGSPRRSNGTPRNLRRADTATTKTLKKENKNDSGQSNGNKWTDDGNREFGNREEQEVKPQHEQGLGRQEVAQPGQFGQEDSVSQKRNFETERIDEFDQGERGRDQEPQQQEKRE